MTVGERIRELRREKDLTLKQLAQASDLSLTYLSDVERGRTTPSLKMIGKIADAFKISTNDLLCGVDELGPVTEEALPQGLRELLADPEWGERIDEEWQRTLLRVDYRGRRPETKGEWLKLYFDLQSLLGDKRR